MKEKMVFFMLIFPFVLFDSLWMKKNSLYSVQVESNNYFNPSTKQRADELCKYYICCSKNKSLTKLALSLWQKLHLQTIMEGRHKATFIGIMWTLEGVTLVKDPQQQPKLIRKTDILYLFVMAVQTNY